MRGGPKAADHVDVMGNTQLIDDILRIVSGFGVERVGDKVHSDIDALSNMAEERLKAGL